MIGNKPPSEIWGVWIRANRTFYWLETGPTMLTYAGDKLRGALMSRGILKFNARTKTIKGQEPYLDMTLETAKEKEYAIERVFLNEHISKSILADEAKSPKAKANPWS